MKTTQGMLNDLLDRFQNYDPTKWVRILEWDEKKQNVCIGDGFREAKYIQCDGLSDKEIWAKVTKYVKDHCNLTK